MPDRGAALTFDATRSPATWPIWTAGICAGALLGALIAVEPRWTALAAVGGIVGAVILWKPYLGFLLVVASIPLDVTGTFGATGSFAAVSVTKALAAITVLSAALHALLRRQPPDVLRWVQPQTLLAALFLAATSLAAFAHPGPQGFAEIGRLAVIIVFMVVTVHFVDRPRRLAHVALVLIAAATLVSAHSLLQRALGGATLSEEWVAQAGAVLDVGEEAIGEMLRTTGTFSHPAWLGLFISITVPLTLYAAWTAGSRRVFLLAFAALFIQILGVFSTYSRMSYVGAALAVVIFTWRRRFGPLLVLFAALAAAAATPALPDDLRARIASIAKYQESSSSLTRIGQQLAGWNMIRANPLTGIGPGNFEHEALDYGRQVPEAYRVEPIGAHNMYVEVAAELGVPGLLIVLALLAVCWHDARRLRRESRAQGDVRTALLWECIGIALLVFAFSALFVHAQYRKEWWLLAALVAAGRTLRTTERQRLNGQVTP